jgi:DNA-binding NtrC family response regulator
VDDDPAGCRLIAAIFGTEGFRVTSAHTGRSGIDAALAQSPDMVLLDLGLPDMSGLQVLEELSARVPQLPIAMLTADRDIRTAVRATRLGACDYLTKPIDHEEVIAVVRRALETSALRAEVEDLRRQLGDGGSLVSSMGPSAQVRDLVEQVATVAVSRFTVLLLGETGTGKELVAQAIHRASERRSEPFVALDCGAIPETLLESELFGHEKGSFTGADRKRQGRFQLAEGGTLFLDEVGNLPQSLQAKLLRVLESQQVVSVGGAKATSLDVRFIAATNDDLPARVSDGRFRADLYFRLAQYTLKLPPLRERPGDIPYLASRFVSEASIELRRPVMEISEDALELLRRQPWPGNVRELRNVVRQAVLKTRELSIEKGVFRQILGKVGGSRSVSPSRAPAGATLREVALSAARQAEHEAICETLRMTQGNKSKAARALSTDYKTLHLKMKSLGIRARDFMP